MKGIHVMRVSQAVRLGYSTDKRKRRNQHRTTGKLMLGVGSFLSPTSRKGTIPHGVAMWHFHQARYLK